MVERAQAMDGNATLKLYPDMGHGDLLLALARGHSHASSVLQDLLAFIAHPPPRAPAPMIDAATSQP